MTADPVSNPDMSLTQQLGDLADQIVAGLQTENKSKVAVIEFTDSAGRVSDLGVFLAEEMITRLFQAGKFQVVERSQLNKVLQEHELNLSGLVDESTAQQLGELLGADAIATGTISDLRDMVRVNSRLISTETGSVFAAAAISLNKDTRVADMMNRFPRPTQGAAVAGRSAAQPAGGEAKVLLSGNANNNFVWQGGSPYLTTVQVLEGDAAFIPTGNNHFYKQLSKIGYEAGEARYLSFWVYLLKKEGCLLLQAHIGKWDHRWRVDGRPNYAGAWQNWAARGQSVNVPTGQWVEIRLDLIDDLGGKPGQTLGGLAFSSTSSAIVYDKVSLILNQ